MLFNISLPACGEFGSKIKFELFQAVVQETPKQQVNFTGESTVDVTLDGETSTILMPISVQGIYQEIMKLPTSKTLIFNLLQRLI